MPLSRNPQFAYRTEHSIVIDDELISKMMENTLRFGVYGKVEQRRRQLALFSPSHMEEDRFSMKEREIMVESPRAQRDQSINMTKGGMSLEEMELLRKENAELMAEIKMMREGKKSPQMVNTTGCCSTTCNIF